MGNAATIYDEKCLVYSPDQLGSCPVYEEHLETMKFITQTGKVLEKTVYQNFNVDTLPDKLRISWFQLIGKSIKTAGQALPEKDPIRSNVITTGRAEKLIGQMENEFAAFCNALLLKPIQEARLYHQESIIGINKEFIQIEKKLKIEEQEASLGNLTSERIQGLENLRNDYQGAHYALHSQVIRIYEVLNQIKLRLPAVIEYQLDMNQYVSNYLEYVLESFRGNKEIKREIKPLKSYHAEIQSKVPDYRESIKNFPKESENRKALLNKSKVPADSAQPNSTSKIISEGPDGKVDDSTLKSQSVKKSKKNSTVKELSTSKKVNTDQDTEMKTSDSKTNSEEQKKGPGQKPPGLSKENTSPVEKSNIKQDIDQNQDAGKNFNHRNRKNKKSLKEKKSKSESLTTASIYN